MHRRGFLTTAIIVGTAGCLARSPSDPESMSTTSDPEPSDTETTTTKSPEDPEREDAGDTPPTKTDVAWGPFRGQGDPITVTKTLTTEPGDGYNAENNTVRVVLSMVGPDEPGEVEYKPFDDWVVFESPNFARGPAKEVTSERLPGNPSLGSAISVPPDDSGITGLVVTLLVSDEVDRTAAINAAPHSVDLTVSYKNSQASRETPVFVENPGPVKPL